MACINREVIILLLDLWKDTSTINRFQVVHGSVEGYRGTGRYCPGYSPTVGSYGGGVLMSEVPL